MKKDEYIEQLENENLGLVQVVADMQSETNREIKRLRAENAKFLSKINELTSRVEDLEGAKGINHVLRTVAESHRDKLRKECDNRKPKYTKEEQKEIDKAWKEMTDEAKELTNKKDN